MTKTSRSNNTSKETRVCSKCYHKFETYKCANHRTLCPDCSAARHEELYLNRYHAKNPPPEFGYTVVYDPDEAPLAPGMVMLKQYHNAMIKNKSYTQGTILQREGRQWKVINRDNKQCLIPWATPQHIYEYISKHPGVTYKELSKALGTTIGEYQLTQLESQGYYLSQDGDMLYAIERVNITPAAPAKHKVYNPFIELLDYLDVE